LFKSYFVAKFNPLGNETCWKVQVLLFLDLLGPFVLFMIRVQIQAPSTWDIEVDFSFTKGFGIPMATSWVDVSYNGSIFGSLWIFYKMYIIQMPQTHCKIINLKYIFMD